jgi:two-component system response regulator AtoC
MKLEARWSDRQRAIMRARLAELERRTHFLQHTLDGLSQSIRIVDQDLNLVYANRAAIRTAPQSASGPTESGTCFHHAGKDEPCEDCPVTRAGLSPEYPYAVMSQGPSNGGRVGAESSCRLVSRIPAPAGRGLAEEPVATAGEPAGVGEDRLGSIIGRSEPMRGLFDMIRLVATSDATVLLEGESGTGKEMVARTVHGLSPRRDHRFVVIDCGALPETLLESELFGHVRGAFTGAVTAKPGLFEEAEGGTIFLDEIADTSPALQAKLLRAIQEGEIKPVGGNRRVKINVRVIAASNKALIPLVAARAFREDLYYRLAVIPITVPLLRQRREDIPLLVEAFVAEACARYGRDLLHVPPEAVRLLTNHSWPGNVRELRHVIERAVLTATGSELAADRLFADLVGTHAPMMSVSSLRGERQDAVRLLERARIVEALSIAKGNKARAARALKISRASFYNKLRDYQIQLSGHGTGAVPARFSGTKTV